MSQAGYPLTIRLVAGVALIAAAVLWLAGPTSRADERADASAAAHEVVLITDHALSPRLVRLDPGAHPTWISYASAPSKIVFEREVAKSMICHQLVNFSIAGDRLESTTMSAGDFASFCELAPGRYRYRVVRGVRTDGLPAGAAEHLDGVIVVGEPS